MAVHTYTASGWEASLGYEFKVSLDHIATETVLKTKQKGLERGLSG